MPVSGETGQPMGCHRHLPVMKALLRAVALNLFLCRFKPFFVHFCTKWFMLRPARLSTVLFSGVGDRASLVYSSSMGCKGRRMFCMYGAQAAIRGRREMDAKQAERVLTIVNSTPKDLHPLEDPFIDAKTKVSPQCREIIDTSPLSVATPGLGHRLYDAKT